MALHGVKQSEIEKARKKFDIQIGDIREEDIMINIGDFRAKGLKIGRPNKTKVKR